jgi:[acyl-carrier-protein] S-malonyltransferase/trans-AT polyketide synthase/acyltransferase/oxidoreductase domain-containing protein
MNLKLKNLNINEEKTMNRQRTAVVFPGQGTQRHGMGKDFYDRFDEARNVFDEASDALGWDVAGLCFGDDPRLHLTEFAQPAILTTEIAMFRCLSKHYGFDPCFFGGHSLGEYTALTAAGVIPLDAAVSIVNTRGRLMQRACDEQRFGMAAVIAEDLDPEGLADAIRDLPVDIANINAKNQVVLSGEKKGLARVESDLTGNTGHQDPVRFVPLNVSAAFHSRFMKPIKENFEALLETFSKTFQTDRCTHVTSNVSGGFHEKDSGALCSALVRQSYSPVKWRENMECLAGIAADIVEVGPARPLRSFFSSQGIGCRAVTTADSAARIFGRNEEAHETAIQ